MRSTKLFGALTFALFLSAITSALAEEAKGTIKSVNTGRKEVVLKGTIKDSIYELEKGASVWLDGVACKLGDLKADDRAIVVFEKSGEHMIAKRVRALRNAQEATGTVRGTLGEKREVTLKGVVKDTTYELTKNATIWHDGKKGTMGDIREGDEVLITYEQRGDRLMANDLVITSRK